MTDSHSQALGQDCQVAVSSLGGLEKELALLVLDGIVYRFAPDLWLVVDFADQLLDRILYLVTATNLGRDSLLLRHSRHLGPQCLKLLLDLDGLAIRHPGRWRSRGRRPTTVKCALTKSWLWVSFAW